MGWERSLSDLKKEKGFSCANRIHEGHSRHFILIQTYLYSSSYPDKHVCCTLFIFIHFFFWHETCGPLVLWRTCHVGYSPESYVEKGKVPIGYFMVTIYHKPRKIKKKIIWNQREGIFVKDNVDGGGNRDRNVGGGEAR